MFLFSFRSIFDLKCAFGWSLIWFNETKTFKNYFLLIKIKEVNLIDFTLNQFVKTSLCLWIDLMAIVTDWVSTISSERLPRGSPPHCLQRPLLPPWPPACPSSTSSTLALPRSIDLQTRRFWMFAVFLWGSGTSASRSFSAIWFSKNNPFHSGPLLKYIFTST